MPVPHVTVAPWEDYNQQLVSRVHPHDWENPQPASRYDLVVIGAGTAGLVTAAGAAGLGAKVALIESQLMGGDCLNVGCVPSKALIRSARAVADVRAAERYGVRVPSGTQIEFAEVMRRMRRIRADISEHDSAQRFRDLGVDVFLGKAKFAGRDTVRVQGSILRFKRATIATGSRPYIPPVEGLDEVLYLTNETVFSLTERPPRLAIIGAGPIGCELAQCFQRLGSQVFLLHRNAHVLDREDADAAAILQQTLLNEGIHLHFNTRQVRVEQQGNEKTLFFESAGKRDGVTVDALLVAAGRVPNTEGLNLTAAGVTCSERKGIIVDDRLRTHNPRIYAAGDCCMDWKFTHAADAAARIVIQNALFGGRKRLSELTMPWCTYTDPEIAHVGVNAYLAAQQAIPIDTFAVPLVQVDRAIAEGEEQGLVKLHVRQGTDTLVGATIVARHAGEMIGEITLAIVGGLGLKTLAGVIHAYPTQAEAIKQAAEAYNRTRLTPLVKWLFSRWLALMR
jgi:pyruvate/2-oxoglutarate dehydrogenase complex dihydrolipoamide dehydrogenase (E3) component